ncbi:MAG: MBL fold metallo-hydrolase [Candidatus Nanopelagicales bacterium]
MQTQSTDGSLQQAGTYASGKKHQATAPTTQACGAEAFNASDGTVLRWLGMAGFLMNSRGTTLMIDPLLEGFDMPLLIEMPIEAQAVPRLDSVLVTHSDNDHYSVPTLRALAGVRYSTGIADRGGARKAERACAALRAE